MPFFAEKGFPNCLQYAYQKEKSCIDASMSLQEAVLYNIERGSKVYCCFLDLTKAFDTVWISGLFYKMYNLGIQGKTWRLLRNWYNILTSRVLIDGEASEEFPVLQGVRQGGVLSPWLFMIFNDDLTKVISECNEGIMLGSLSCNPIMFADDITLLSTRINGLQKMLNTLESYSLSWRFEFSSSKTTIVTFGETTQMHNKTKGSREWILCNVAIAERVVWPHVGVELSGNFSSSHRTEEACKKAKFVMSCLINIGARPNALNPICAASLWRIVGIPTVLYGCELWNSLTANEIAALERTQRFNARRIQGLHPKTRSEAVTGSLGLWSIEGLIDKAKLLYFGRLCRSRSKLISKQIFIVRLFSYFADPTKQRGLIPDIIRILKKYSLISYLTTYVDDLSFPGKSSWKTIVFNQIEKYETEKWKNGMLNKEELIFYQRIHTSLKPLRLWEIAKKNPSQKLSITFLVNIMCGNIPQNFHSWVVHDDTELRCVFCNLPIWNCNFHFIMSCTNFNTWRNNMWDEIIDQLPVHLSARLYSLDDSDLYQNIISGNIPGVNVDICLNDKLLLIVTKYIRQLLRQTN